LKSELGRNQNFQHQERRISIVRIAGVMQSALDQKVESEMLLNPKASVCNVFQLSYGVLHIADKARIHI
jgi:hypothetical protein